MELYKVYCPKRRQILKSVALAMPATALPVLGLASAEPRQLRFNHTHTGDKLNLVYHENGVYLPDGAGRYQSPISRLPFK